MLPSYASSKYQKKQSVPSLGSQKVALIWINRDRLALDQTRSRFDTLKLIWLNVEKLGLRKASSKGAFDAAYRENRRAVAVHYGSCPFQY
jgi:hypothetical protein